MQADYLPKYFQDNNAGKHQDTDPMTSDYRSFYAFRIGDHYIDCMDLADQIEIADTEPETQAEAVAQEVETPESQTIASDTSEEKDTSSMLINSETEISAESGSLKARLQRKQQEVKEQENNRQSHYYRNDRNSR